MHLTFHCRSIVGIVAACSLMLASRAAAQAVTPEKEFREILPFMDSTFVGFGFAGGETTFEADIVPNFVVRETLFAKLKTQFKSDAATRKSQHAYAFTGVPMVKLRMFINQPSAPVRTPSYMPKGTFQYFFFQPGRTKTTNKSTQAEEQKDTIDLYSFIATVGHHSNGQDGCLYKVEQLPDCAPPAGGITPAMAVNTHDGSFSTNYLLFSGRYRFVVLQDPAGRSTAREGDYELTAGADLELNPGSGNFLGGGGIDADQKALYGSTRLSGLFSAAAHDLGLCYRLEGKTSVKYIHGQLADGVSNFAEMLEGTCLFRETGWGLMARFYHGQDYYNLGYGQNVTRLQLGLTYSQEGFLRFHLR